MLNRAMLGLWRFSAKEASRFALETVAISREEAVATNGHVLFRVSATKAEPENYPVVEGFTPTKAYDPFLISVEQAKAAEKAVPKKTNIPVLAHAVIEQNGHGTRLATGQLGSITTLTVDKIEGTYPPIERVIPKGKPKHSITVSAAYLRQIADYVATYGAGGHVQYITMEFYGPKEAMSFRAESEDGQQMQAVLMPIRT